MFDPATARLFQPVRVGKLTLPNRLALLPVTTMLERNEEITDDFVAFYEARAKGGVGLTITGNISLVSSRGLSTTFPGIYSDRFIPGLRRLTEAVHRYGVPIIAQVGTMHHWQASEDSPLELVAPSPVPIHRQLPRELTLGEIEAIVERFAQAIKRSRESGFDGAEILACQGALVSRFLSPATNRRRDHYGGGLEARARLLLDIVRRAKELVGNDYVLGVRLSLDELIEGGMTLEDSLPLCPMLEQAGVHLLDAEVGWHESAVPHLQSVVKPGSLTYVARAAKNTVNIPVVTAQRINSVCLAEQILERGDADIVGMARGLIADPDLPAKARAGRLSDIRSCICCMRCNEAVYSEQIRCSVNPQAGYENRRIIEPVGNPKRVFVIGGGPAGMEAALVARSRGHEVELIERRPELGGQLLEAGLPPHKSEIADFTAYLVRQVQGSGVKVHLGFECDLATIEAKQPDVVILASGSQPLLPPIPGVNRPNVFAASEALKSPGRCGRRVVVIGGGLIGCETALALVQGDRDITIVEMLKKVGADMGPMTRWVMLRQLEMAGVKLEPNTRAIEIGEQAVVCERDGVRVLFLADTVVLAAGMTSDRSLADAVRTRFSKCFLIGDCLEPKRILEAVTSGFLAGCQV